MIGSHQTTAWLALLDAKLPEQVADPAWAQPMPKAALLGTIRTRLLPFVTGGHTYRRAVDDSLSIAIRMFREQRGAEFLYWLGEASAAAAR